MEELLKHWENIYVTKTEDEVSWTQLHPEVSLNLIAKLSHDKSDSIIDIGGGDSRLADHLLAMGYSDITVLDISEAALARARARLGADAEKITWICADIRAFNPERTYDIWHDRACFHFLTDDQDRERYIELVGKAANKALIIGTFSESGPLKCSGLFVQRYSVEDLQHAFHEQFKMAEQLQYNHDTPFGTQQHFTFGGFIKF